MNRMPLALAMTLLIGCAGTMPLARKGAILILTPRITNGSFQTQATVSVYSSASIDHLTLRLFEGGTELVNKTIPNSALSNPITFSNLRVNTSYRIKAYAYLADNTLISHDDPSSWLDIMTETDDRPSLNPIPIHLKDIPFNGQASSGIQVTPGGYSSTGPEMMGFLMKGVISTVAGGGTGTDGNSATNASLYLPRGIAFDSLGNLYIADRGNARIRKVDKATGVISTVAGNGATGFSGDGGAATAANISTPEFIAFDSQDNLYFSDSGNNRIRKVAKNGIISTFTGNGGTGFSGDGGPATNTTIESPSGLAFDSLGNLYITDNGNRRIRKVDKTTGLVSTYAGIGSATGFYGDGGPATAAPIGGFGITFDTNDNLYLADYGFYRIRKIDRATGNISTVAGNGGTGYSGDGGPATAAEIYKITDVKLDRFGNFYIAEWNNHHIRKVDTNGIITTFAGNGALGVAGDGGPATAANIAQPFGLALDAEGNLHICTYNGGRVRVVR